MKKIKINLGTPLTRSEMQQISGGVKHGALPYVFKCPGLAAFCGKSSCGHTGCVATTRCSNPVC